MGRSRKPLTGQPVRGFESHPLRHRRSFPGRAGCEGPALPEPLSPRKAIRHEENIPAQQPPAQEDPRFRGRMRTRQGRAVLARRRRKGASVWRSDGRGARPPGGRAGRGPTRDQRLRRRADYLRCYRQGRRRHGALAVLQSRPPASGSPGWGSRRAARWATRCAPAAQEKGEGDLPTMGTARPLPAIDVVVHLKPAAATADFAPMKRAGAPLGSLLPADRARAAGPR